MTKIAIVLGTRPEIIKLSPVIRECERQDIDFELIHTGQHYSENLDQVFFDQLELPEPDYHLKVGSKSHGQQTAAMIAGIEDILVDTEPDILLVQGDTNSVLAGAIAASKLDMDLGHVEAGLRSFNREMPEETNRVLTDHTADHLFAPTAQSVQYLRSENIDENRIHQTGNTVVDAVHQHASLAEKNSSVLQRLGLEQGEYILMTAHRPGNVDDAESFQALLRGMSNLGMDLGLDVIYPIHPRAEASLDELDVDVPEQITLVEPQEYLDFLRLEAHARLIGTDSGGIQEEACILGVPCVTLREETERPETIEVGANMLVGTDPERITSGAYEMLAKATDWTNPFGSGDAAIQILDIMKDEKPVRKQAMNQQT
ncbi:non-hydrolyzing UDP-N-acetylglucosamine 2-epimerase [Haloarcula amylovorans]|uniref:non-hydrolyzing UDP-N-acetylglucosamine 2-epimerase n=1 Tax=Haloarcula amylovorans TaxID=2562280 RepID=UPI0037429A7A